MDNTIQILLTIKNQPMEVLVKIQKALNQIVYDNNGIKYRIYDEERNN